MTVNLPLDTLVCPYLAIARHFNVDYGDVLLLSDWLEGRLPGGLLAAETVADRLKCSARYGELHSRILGSALDWSDLQRIGIEAFKANRPKRTFLKP
jgi:hypothetical protein